MPNNAFNLALFVRWTRQSLRACRAGKLETLGWNSPLIDKRPTAAEYIALYEQGLYTRAEIVSLFVTWAAEHSPENLIHEIPVEFVSGIRDLVAEPPKSIADVFAPKSGPAYVDAWFSGCWSWNHFFFHTNGASK